MTLSRDIIVSLPFLGEYVAKEGRDASSALRAAAFLTTEGENAFSRENRRGHLTASGFIVSKDRTSVLLMHHRKLDLWLQPGGHCDGNLDVLAVARQEIFEETGLQGLRLVSPGIFDVDAHDIPARKNEPAHRHYDIRFLFEADPATPLVPNGESKDLRWIEIARLGDITDMPSAPVARRAGAIGAGSI